MAHYSPRRLQACLDQNPPPEVLPELTISTLDLSNADLSAILTPIKRSPRKLLVPPAECTLVRMVQEEVDETTSSDRQQELGRQQLGQLPVPPAAHRPLPATLQPQPAALERLPAAQQPPDTVNHPQPAAHQPPPTVHQPARSSTPAPLRSCLHAALVADCRRTSLPFTLFCPPPLPTDPALLSSRQTSLEAQFLAVQGRASRAHLTDLHTFYLAQKAQIETDRLASLHFTAPTPWLHPTVHGYFDFHQLQLISRVEASLVLLHGQCEEQLHQRREKRRAAVCPTASRGRRGTPFSPTAVAIMTKWYDQNLAHPYPSREASEVMAVAGGLSVEQVRKWFCNKRKRAGNTQTLGQIAASRHRGRHLTAETLLLGGTRKGLD